jgi:large subunit ribosomal protein L10
LSLNIEDKKAVVAEISAEVAKAQTIIVAEYRGIEVASMTQLRKQARESGVYLRVLKNTLARRAVQETPFAGLADKMVGPLVYGISEDPVAAAKVLFDFSKKDDKIVVKAGSYDDNQRHLPREVLLQEYQDYFLCSQTGILHWQESA